MKTLKAIFLVSAAMMFTFCKETPEDIQPVAELSVSGISGTITAGAEGAQYPFKVTADRDWSLTAKDLDWAQFSVRSGKADKEVSVTLTVPEYTGEQLREGTFTITADDAAKTSKTFTVRQSGVDPVARDSHAAGYEFFADDFNWITALWPAKFDVSKYGWPSVKVDDVNWNEYGISTDTPTADAFDSRGYVYDGTNTYCRYEGYVKFGRAAQVGSLATPALSGIDDATVATLSVKWDASMYVTGGGFPDEFQQISVSVSGNGSIVSCSTDGATIEEGGKKAIIPILGDADHRFRWTRKEVIVVDADKETRIMLGASEEMKARCFADNISITRAAEGASAGEDNLLPLPALEKEISMSTDMPVGGGGADVNLSVRINREWSIASDKEWLTISKVASGGTSDGVVIAEDKLSTTVPGTCLPFNNVVLRAAENPDPAQRTATVTVSADGAAQQTFTVTQEAAEPEPDPTVSRVLAQWNFSGITSGSTKGSSWAAGGTAPDDDSSGAAFSFVKGPNVEEGKTITFSVGTTTMNKNRFRAHRMYLNDCIEFSVPVRNIPAGSTVVFENCFLSATQYGPKYWMQEYSLDNGATWSAAAATTTEATVSPTDPTRQVTYTHMLPLQDSPLPMNCTINVANNIKTGYVKMRMRVCDIAQAKTSNGDILPDSSTGITYLHSSQDLFTTETRDKVIDVDGVYIRFVYMPAP